MKTMRVGLVICIMITINIHFLNTLITIKTKITIRKKPIVTMMIKMTRKNMKKLKTKMIMRTKLKRSNFIKSSSQVDSRDRPTRTKIPRF